MIDGTRSRVRRFSTGLVLPILIIIGVFFSVRFALIQGLPTVWHPPIAKLHWFEVKDVRIHTEPPLKEEVLIKYLPELKGRSLLTIQPAELYEKLRDKPWVDGVSIKKEYPDRITFLIEPKKARAISFQDGVPYLLDIEGKKIEKVSKGAGPFQDLPFINGDLSSSKWRLETLLTVYYKLKEQLGASAEISEIRVAGYPTFKVFLSKPRVEVLFSVDSWEKQVPILLTLLAGSPRQMKQIHKINLLFPKKAVVTRPNSH